MPDFVPCGTDEGRRRFREIVKRSTESNMNQQPSEIAWLCDVVAPLLAECEAVFIPFDAHGLVRHHRNNAGLAGAMQAEADLLGKLSPETRAQVLREIRS